VAGYPELWPFVRRSGGTPGKIVGNTDLLRAVVVALSVFVKETAHDDTAEYQDRRNWQMMQTKKLMPQPISDTFVAGKRVSASNTGKA
jgi:hypothetical protein